MFSKLRAYFLEFVLCVVLALSRGGKEAQISGALFTICLDDAIRMVGLAGVQDDWVDLGLGDEAWNAIVIKFPDHCLGNALLKVDKATGGPQKAC